MENDEQKPEGRQSASPSSRRGAEEAAPRSAAVGLRLRDLKAVARLVSRNEEELLRRIGRLQRRGRDSGDPAVETALDVAAEVLGELHLRRPPSLEGGPVEGGPVEGGTEATDEADPAASTRSSGDEDPSVVAVLAELGVWLTEVGDFGRAARLLVGLDRLRPQRPEPALLLGGLEVARGNLSAAERCYRDALFRDPRSPWAHALLSECLLRQGRLAEARQMARRSRDADGVDDPQEIAAGLARRVLDALAGPSERPHGKRP